MSARQRAERAERAEGAPARRAPAYEDSAFLRACRGLPNEATPVWLMRQAGRYMREYRAVRERVSFIELCRSPDLAAEVAITALDAIGADAAILFSDILLILAPMGMDLEYPEEGGPVLRNPLRAPADVDRLSEAEPRESLSFVFEAVRKTREQMNPALPLIGFCGAPFTLASYMIEGGGSRHFESAKKFMYADPGAWRALMEKLVRGLTEYLNEQIRAGAQAVQIFDSWAGCLAPEDFREFVLPHSRALIRGIAGGAPVIHFGTGTAPFLEDFAGAGGEVVGLDFRVEMAAARERLGDRPVQGNLDPCALLAPPARVRARAERVLREGAARPGHVFNLGHGVLPNTPVDSVKRLIDFAHEWRAA